VAGKSSILLLYTVWFFFFLFFNLNLYQSQYEKHIEDASLLLEGSSGRIGCVLLTKLFPLS
jgi:hypothetical protein